MPLESKLVEEFFEVLDKSKAKNGCIMLPGHIQYWRPNAKVTVDVTFHGKNCKSIDSITEKYKDPGVKDILIDEPIHFAGPSPETPVNS